MAYANSSASPDTVGSGASGPAPANLGDILERVLDKGLVIAGDIQVNLLDIELLTIKLRLVVASLETAREVGINWWEHDPWMTGDHHALEEENRELRQRIEELENGGNGDRALEPAEESGASPESESERKPAQRRKKG